MDWLRGVIRAAAASLAALEPAPPAASKRPRAKARRRS
jgi:hypothetical protein